MNGTERTAAFLRPWLGSAFVAAHADLMARLAFKLSQFHPGRNSLHTLAQELDSTLFMAVREATGGRMILGMDDGRYMRVRVDDFAVMADELLYLTLERLPRNQECFVLIRDYSMRHGSLAALKALYLHFQALQGEEEYRTVIRVIQTCHPPFRWRQWLENQ